MKLSFTGFRQQFAIYMCPKGRFDGILFFFTYLRHFPQYFNFIGVRILSTQRIPQTCRVTDNLNHVLLYRVHLDMSLLRTRNISADRH